jgi:hypothetical protein
MTSTDDSAPHQLRQAILRDLAPVRPVLPPSWRTFLLLLPALPLALAPPMGLGVRRDAHLLGPVVLWGASLVQGALGALLLFAALREAVPGRELRLARMLLATGFAAALAITGLTWSHSATTVPPGRQLFFWEVCFVGPMLLGLPVVFVALWLALRAYPLRPALAGALAGLGVGLLIDAGWRTYCHVSDPRHVLAAHASAVAALCAVAALSSAVLSRRQRA